MVTGAFARLFETPLGLGVILLLLAFPLVAGHLIMLPLTRQVRFLQAPTRFVLTDFLWLMVMLQVALGFCMSQAGENNSDDPFALDNRAYLRILLGFMLPATAALWAGGVGFLSRAGVNQPRRRAVFLLFLLPATVCLMMLPSIVVVKSAENEAFMWWLLELWTRWTWLSRLGASAAAAAVALCVLCASCVLLRRVSAWIIAGAPLQRAVPPAESAAGLA